MRRTLLGVVLAASTVVAGCTIGGEPVPETVIITPSTVEKPAAPTFEASPIDGPIAPGSTGRLEVTAGDKTRDFLLHVPEGYSQDQDWPLVLAFHGYKETPEELEKITHFDDAAALVAYPRGVQRAWSPAPYAKTSMDEDIAYSEKIVERVSEHYRVAEDAVNVVGFSNGGGFAAALGCRIPERIAAVGTVSGAYYENVHEDCVDTPVPLIDLHGTNDSIIGYYGGTRHETAYDSVPDVLDHARIRNGCHKNARVTRENVGTISYRWPGCEAALEHVRIGGGGHVWPGSAGDGSTNLPAGYATYRILRFFDIRWN